MFKTNLLTMVLIRVLGGEKHQYIAQLYPVSRKKHKNQQKATQVIEIIFWKMSVKGLWSPSCKKKLKKCNQATARQRPPGRTNDASAKVSRQRIWFRKYVSPARSLARTKRNDFPLGAAGALTPPHAPIYTHMLAWTGRTGGANLEEASLKTQSKLLKC